VLNLHSTYDITHWFELFANAQNVLDRRYYTFGTFSPTNSVFLAQDPNATNPRSYSLAEPLGFFGGVRVKF
jgi:outer membrane receptor protein involved in Fe transport